MSVTVSYEKTIAGITERWQAEGDSTTEALMALRRMLPRPEYKKQRNFEKAVRTLQETQGVGDES